MSSTASKVADIFTAAGAAFNRLGELTVQLHPLTNDSPQTAGSKWGDEEIEMLKSSVQRFGEDLKKLSEIIKTKSITQIKTALKHRMYNDQNVALTSPKKTQKRTASQSATSDGQNEEVKAKKAKGEESSGKVKSLSFKEMENDVDIESIFEDVNGQRSSIQTLDPVDSEVPSEILSSDVASS